MCCVLFCHPRFPNKPFLLLRVPRSSKVSDTEELKPNLQGDSIAYSHGDVTPQALDTDLPASPDFRQYHPSLATIPRSLLFEMF